MNDWENLVADVDDILETHYSSGRSGHSIDKVVVHYNGGDLTVEGCWRVWQTREASAHYQVESGGRIGQLVRDADTAWHAANWTANCTSIGIEHANREDGTISDACLDAGAHLVAAVCRHYGLGRPEWLVNVFPHCHFSSTSCPGEIYGAQKDAYIQRAQHWYDVMEGTVEDEEDKVEVKDLVDPSWYYSNYSDVARAYGDGARTHFATFGAGEHRRPSALFDCDYYRTRYSDLDAAFGDDVAAYAQHFATYGVKEGRRGSREFDPAYYRRTYPDLDAAFGDDWESYYRHYLAYGHDEGRTAHDPSEDAA